MRPAAFINGVIRGKSRHTEAAREKPEIGEVVYEERDGRKVPVGKRYQYDTNSEGSNCWILVQWESVRDFETCIGY